jgi:hypothetical protein
MGLITRLVIPILQIPTDGKTAADVQNELVENQALQTAKQSQQLPTEAVLTSTTEPIVSANQSNSLLTTLINLIKGT